MAYNQKLGDRVREIITRTHSNVVEKRMFGGLCFMVNDKMCIGVEQDRMMVVFVGHAIDIDKEAFLIPIDGQKEEKETLIPLKNIVAGVNIDALQPIGAALSGVF